jgi:hypothetical protein
MQRYYVYRNADSVDTNGRFKRIRVSEHATGEAATAEAARLQRVNTNPRIVYWREDLLVNDIKRERNIKR